MNNIHQQSLPSTGHACRKLEQLAESVLHYETALGLCPLRAFTYTSLGFVEHMRGHLDLAIERYHQGKKDTLVIYIMKLFENMLENIRKYVENIA